jgi:5'-deoxynucleotidase YfbR-like HD superfamily hydrolase
MSFIQTYSGAKFDFADPAPASIRLKDIAHALARICRFGGHVATFYPVADHCVNVTRFLIRNGADRQTAAWGCMHDAAEAYVGDIVSPFKQMLPKAGEIEQRIAAMIRERFGIDEGQVDFDAVKRADEALLVAEAKALFDFPPLENWTESFRAEPVRDPLHISRGPREAESFYLLIAAQVL